MRLQEDSESWEDIMRLVQEAQVTVTWATPVLETVAQTGLPHELSTEHAHLKFAAFHIRVHARSGHCTKEICSQYYPAPMGLTAAAPLPTIVIANQVKTSYCRAFQNKELLQSSPVS